MANDDPVVASLGDALLRKSDVRLLDAPHWLNDRIIGYFFEYLHQHRFEASSRISFISPEVSQFLKMLDSSEIPTFLEPLELERKDIVSLAVNNASDPDSPGGSHWSLLLFDRQEFTFHHFDSSAGINEEDAKTIARKLYEFLMPKVKNRERDSFTTRSNEFKFVSVPVLRQDNGYDCGIHVLCNAELAVRHIRIYGSTRDLPLVDPKVIKSKRQELKRLISVSPTTSS